MGIKKGKNTLLFDMPISVLGHGSVVGKEEGKGPMAKAFDVIIEDDFYGEKSFEKAESKLQQTAITQALRKANLTIGDIDLIAAGDLLNQCTAQSFGLLDENIPYIGIYGACSNMAEGLILSSVLVNSGCAKIAAASTSSHFCTAERQFRFPIEYGGQRTPVNQNTVTGAASFIVESSFMQQGDYVFINEAVIGRIIDMGVTDQNNMGAAMANAALDTIKRYFMQTNLKPN